MTRFLPLGLAIVLLLTSGLVRARWSPDSEELRAASARIDQLPRTVGDWEGEPADFDGRGLDRAGIAGFATRRYHDRRTGATITILLVCGRPGPIAVHGPEVCYASAGYEQASPMVARTLGDDSFWMARFRKAGPVGGVSLQIDWAWSTAGHWQAAENPRLQYAKHKVLYKLYLISDAPAPGGRDEDDPCAAFAGEFLPAIRRVVTPGS